MHYICILQMKKNTHNKQYVFHAQVATRTYDVCYDLFHYLARRRGC